jgi:DNA (cytosine-5)-methyltransferase 1
MALSLDTAAALLAQPEPPIPAGQLAIDDGPRIGSLCSGYRGLDMAVEAVFGGTTAWVSDIDPGASKILAHHWPTVPNLGDLTTTDWAAVEPVDIVCGGYPCQPFSNAGLRKGIEDERHIWPYIADALRVLRPRRAIFENVAGHLRRGFDTVLADLADLGFDVEWCTVRASEVGAPHRRERLFIVATAQDADSATRDQRRLAAPRQAESRRARPDAGRRGGTPAADTDGDALREQPVGESGRRSPAVAELPGAAPADAGRLGLHEHGELPPGRDALRRGLRDDAPRCGTAAPAEWGRFTPAIRRWEHATGRPAPRAVDDRRRLSPAFVEWLMGLPAGHVTDVPDLTRNQQLHALGNGVVPQQATAALRLLTARIAA